MGSPKPGERFYDVIILVLGLWCLGGLLIDAFAHIGGRVDDTFFTEWHAVWYCGATAYGAYMFYAVMPEGGGGEMLRRPWRAQRRRTRASPGVGHHRLLHLRLW